MRALFTADLHGGTSRYSEPVAGPLGSSRLVEFEAILATLGDAAIEHECGYVWIGGDLWDHRHPTPTMLRLFSEFCARMIAAGIKVLMVPGNHDGAATIGTEASHTHRWMAALALADVRVYTRPTIDRFEDLTIVAMPYPHRRALDDKFADLPPEERVIAAGREMGELIRHYGEDARSRDVLGDRWREAPLVFLGHLTVLGSRTASEQLMRMAWDVAVEPEAFEAFDFVALGHIHKMQGVGERVDAITNAAHERAQRIWYPGSPIYLDFSEAGNAKGFLLVEHDGKTGTVVPIRSSPRNMVRVKLDYWPEYANATLTGLPETMSDAIVELTVTGTTRPPQAWIESQERAFKAAGVHSLKTKINVTSPDAVPALVAMEDATDLTDKTRALARYLRERNLPEEPYLTAHRGLIEQ